VKARLSGGAEEVVILTEMGEELEERERGHWVLVFSDVNYVDWEVGEAGNWRESVVEVSAAAMDGRAGK